jgi:hypothetical protein
VLKKRILLNGFDCDVICGSSYDEIFPGEVINYQGRGGGETCFFAKNTKTLLFFSKKYKRIRFWLAREARESLLAPPDAHGSSCHDSLPNNIKEIIYITPKSLILFQLKTKINF